MSDFRPLDGDLEVDLAEQMGQDWNRIGIRLGVGREISGIREDFQGQFTRAWEVLQSWKRYRGKGATVEELYLTLLKCRRKDLADLLWKPDRDDDDAQIKFTIRSRSCAISSRDGQRLRSKLNPFTNQISTSAYGHRPSSQVALAENRKSQVRDDAYVDQLRETNDIETHQYGSFVYKQEDTDLYHEESLYTDLPGYFKQLSRQHGARKLVGKPNGTYLIRGATDSEQASHKHTLMLVVKGEISNIKIFSCEDGSVYADSLEHLRKTFRNLEELISWHKTNIIKHFSSFGVFDFHLTDPVTDGTEGHTVL
jgi:hypothetical protein